MAGLEATLPSSADGFVDLAGHFDLTKTTTLLTLTLTNPTVFVGIGGSVNTTAFTVTDGSVGFHGSAPSIVVGLDTANHYGVAVHGLAASVVGVERRGQLAVEFPRGGRRPDPAPTSSAVDPTLTGTPSRCRHFRTRNAAASADGFVNLAPGRLRPDEAPRRC